MEEYDAIVIGAGPAGASLALRLSRAGRRCLVIDGATFPRHKVCGEGIMPAGVKVLDELGLGESARELGHAFHGIRYRLLDGTKAEAQFPDGMQGLAIARHELDALLVDALRAEANVDLRLGSWVRSLELPAKPGDLGRVRFGEAEARAPILVGADGCRSGVRRMAGLEQPLPKRQRFGLRGHFGHAPRTEPRPLVEVVLGSGLELYMTQVRPDVSTVAMLVSRGRIKATAGDKEGALRRALAASPETGAALADAPLLTQVRALGPLGLQAKRAHDPGLILVGDAAGGLDPVTGEGVALALETCGAAFEVLQGCYAASDFSAARLAAWTQRRKQIIRDLAAFTRVVLFLADHPRQAARVVRTLARSPESFQRLLGVASGARPLSSLSVRDGVRVLLGV